MRALLLLSSQSRRCHFEPILLKTCTRVSPCYPYRYKQTDESDEKYSQRLAFELEEEILRLGPGTVAAFFAETGRNCPQVQSGESMCLTFDLL